MTNETSLPAKQRIWELDALRGLNLISFFMFFSNRS